VILCVIYRVEKKTKFWLSLKLSPTICQGASLQQYSQSAPDFIQIGSLFRRSYSRTSENRQIAPLSESNISAEYDTIRYDTILV